MLRFRFLFALFLLPLIAHAQLSTDDAKRYLTNGRNRTWALDGYTPTLGSCHGNDQTFQFFSIDTVAWLKCTDGNPQLKRLGFSISADQQASNSFIITFSEPIEIDGKKFISLPFTLINPELKKKGIVMHWSAPRVKKEDRGESITLKSQN